MTCSHCAEAVSRALSRCHDVAAVQVDLAAGRAVVIGEGLRPDELVAAVESAGYRAQPVMRRLAYMPFGSERVGNMVLTVRERR